MALSAVVIASRNFCRAISKLSIDPPVIMAPMSARHFPDAVSSAFLGPGVSSALTKSCWAFASS
jgi:hypothetical protein